MKIKLSDLRLLMQYLEKEKPEIVEVDNRPAIDNGIEFSFKDTEGRDCTIKLFNSEYKTTPDLIKKMKLYSRFAKASSQPGSEDSSEE